MTIIRKSDAQLDAEASGPAVHAANAAIRDAGPDTRFSPMGAMPPILVCEGPHRQRVVVRDRHSYPHITTCCLALEARREWHYAHPEDLHVFRVPSDPEYVPGVGSVLDVGELGGPPFAPSFASYLQSPFEPFVRAMREYRVKCAGQHAQWPEHRGRAVCATLLWSFVANGNSLDAAADAADLTPERASALLFDALRLIWTWRAQAANAI